MPSASRIPTTRCSSGSSRSGIGDVPSNPGSRVSVAPSSSGRDVLGQWVSGVQFCHVPVACGPPIVLWRRHGDEFEKGFGSPFFLLSSIVVEEMRWVTVDAMLESGEDKHEMYPLVRSCRGRGARLGSWQLQSSCHADTTRVPFHLICLRPITKSLQLITIFPNHFNDAILITFD